MVDGRFGGARCTESRDLPGMMSREGGRRCWKQKQEAKGRTYPLVEM